jgi:NhaP-type Na+/H+ or K+/H+ antiporter
MEALVALAIIVVVVAYFVTRLILAWAALRRNRDKEKGEKNDPGRTR